MKFSRSIVALIVIAAPCISSTLAAKTFTVTQKEQTNLAITLYSDNLALVQDSRILGSLNKNDTVIVHNISQQMHPQSLQIHNAGKISEQTLNKAIISYSALINSFIGQDIILVKDSAGNAQEIRQKVKLLNASNNTAIVEINGAIETIPLNSEKWRFVFPSKPDYLLLKPSLTFKSEGKKETNNIKLSYLTNGLQWQMDYLLALNKTRDKLQIKGLASLFNNTNTDFNNASIKLIAGSISQPAPPNRNLESTALLGQAVMSKARRIEAAPQAIGDLQLYPLPNRASLRPNQQTQLPLLQAAEVPVKATTRYRFHISPYLDSNNIKVNPDSFLTFHNNKKSKLGIALPAGQARVFNPDKTGDLQFIGASHFKQSAVNDVIELSTGRAFDITIKQRQSSYEKTFNGALVGIELKINNSSAQDTTLDLSSSFSHQWEIISSTYPVHQKQAARADWKIKVKANSVTVFNLKTRLKTKQ